jgi:hypothetical protein
MADTVANIAKGRVIELAKLGLANDALIAIPLEATGIESDAVLADYDTVAAVLAAASNEQTTMGRKTLTGVVTSTDDTNNRQALDFDNPVWLGATGNPTAKLLIAYDNDTTAGTDADLVPLVFLDMAATPNGNDLTYNVNAAGAFHAS